MREENGMGRHRDGVGGQEIVEGREEIGAERTEKTIYRPSSLH